MNPQWIQLLISFILQIGPPAVEEFLKVESQLNLSPSEKANIANAIASAHHDNADVMNMVQNWMQAHGFKPVTQFVPLPQSDLESGDQKPAGFP